MVSHSFSFCGHRCESGTRKPLTSVLDGDSGSRPIGTPSLGGLGGANCHTTSLNDR